MKRIFSFLIVVFFLQTSIAQKNKNQEYELINHVVEFGETVKLISKKYLVDPGEIYQLNKFAIDGISKGMVLQIPVPVKDPVLADDKVKELVKKQPVAKVTEKKEPTKISTTPKVEIKQPAKEVAVIDRGSEIEHTVEPKETLYSLSKKYGVSADEIKLSNEQIAVSGLQVGMIVKIPGTKKINVNESSIGSTKTPVAEVIKPQEKEVVSQAQIVTHVVEPKETLYSLSKKYGTTVDEIVKQNQAGLVNGLKIGQTLTITKK
jgi:LysM repeat protein